jgi:hypothetical protein
VRPDDGIASGGVSIQCEPAEGSLQLNDTMPDVRTLAVGTYVLAEAPALLFFMTGLCGGGTSGGQRTVVITRADGGEAPYPAAVSDDYVRESSLPIEVQKTEGVEANGCTSPAVTATADLQSAVSAADAVNDPNAVCGCV